MYKMDNIDLVILSEPTYDARYRYAEDYISESVQNLYFLAFDTSRPPFDDIRVRRAFAMAVDRERLANDVLEGFVDPATGGLVPPTIPGHSPGIGLPYDPAQARQLLAQAGYPDGQGFLTLELAWTEKLYKPLEYLKSQWMDNLNVEVAVEITDWENILRMYDLNRAARFMGWDADYLDPDSYLRVGVRSQVPRWRNDKYSQLVEEAQRTMDQPERISLYQEADKILIEEAVVIPMIYWHGHYLVNPWVKNPLARFAESYFKNYILEPH